MSKLVRHDGDAAEAAMHRAIKIFLNKRQQGMAMDAYRKSAAMLTADAGLALANIERARTILEDAVGLVVNQATFSECRDRDSSVAKINELLNELDAMLGDPEQGVTTLMREHRIAVTPEHEGQWHADLYGHEAEPLFRAEGDTPDLAVRAAVALLRESQATQEGA